MGGALLTVAAASLLAVTALLVVWTLRLRGLAALVVGFLVVASAEVVALTIVLSLLEAWKSGWMLLGQAILALVAVGFWLRAGKPRRPIRGRLPARRTAFDWARRHPAATGMAVIAVLALAVQLVMAIAVAPNNWDSMTYHLSRIAYWLQFDSALHYDNGTVRQLANPPNGEYLQAWTMLFSGSDRLVSTVQWLALVGIAACVAGIARDVRFSRPAALFAAALFVCLPQPILQAATTQNDLITAFFVVAAVMFGFRGLRDRSTAQLALFSAALGVAIGTKGTALLTVPLIGLILVLAVWRLSVPLRFVARGVAFAIAGAVLLGSFNYVLNQDTFGDPLGHLPQATERTSPVVDNAIRDGWTLADSTGVALPWLDVGLRRPVNKVLGDVRNEKFTGYGLDTAVHEDTSAFGLLGMVALLLLAGVALWWRTPWDRRALAIAALAYLVLFFVANEYNVWLGRLMIVGVALGAPLLALLHRWGWTRGLAVALVLLSLPAALFMNPMKPLFVEPGQPTVFAFDRILQQTLGRGDIRPALYQLEALMPNDARIGLVRDEDSWDYPVFGEGLEREVIPLGPEDRPQQAIREHDLDGVLYANVPPPADAKTHELAAGYYLALPRR